MTKHIYILLPVLLIALTTFKLSAMHIDYDYANRQGCCSHHGGVCGCNQATGHLLCCDGADSPSCLCGR